MGKKTTLLIGLGIGYVLGTRAGRDRYEQLKALARRLRETPLVAKPLDAAGEKTAQVIRNKGGELSDRVAEGVKAKMFGMDSNQLIVIEETPSTQ